MKLSLPPYLKEVVKEAGKRAESLGYKVYLVGGVVRDLLLGRETEEVDLAVEGDALKLAEELAKAYGVEVHSFPQFMTAHLKVGPLKLELATARRERYERPGAYPQVEPATLEEDLKRRDFTVNAMALSLNPEEEGTLVDPLGGLKDLKSKTLRILKPDSFVEDPVRMFRALRFAGRLDFKLSPETEEALKEAVKLGVIKEAPRGRLLEEIKLALKEEELPRILKLHERYETLEGLLPVRWDAPVGKLEKVVAYHRERFPEERLPYGWLFLLLLLKEADEEEVREFLKEVGAPAWVRESWHFLKGKYGELLKALREERDPFGVYKLLKGLKVPQLLLLAVGEEEAVKLYLEKLRFVKVPKEEVERLKSKGLKGRELGEALEKLKGELMRGLTYPRR